MAAKLRGAWSSYKEAERYYDEATAAYDENPGDEMLERLWDAAYSAYYWCFNDLAQTVANIVGDKVPGFDIKAARAMVAKNEDRRASMVESMA